MCEECEIDEGQDPQRAHVLDLAIITTQFVGNVAEDFRVAWHGLTNVLMGHRNWLEEQRNFQGIVNHNQWKENHV